MGASQHVCFSFQLFMDFGQTAVVVQSARGRLFFTARDGLRCGRRALQLPKRGEVLGREGAVGEPLPGGKLWGCAICCNLAVVVKTNAVPFWGR